MILINQIKAQNISLQLDNLTSMPNLERKPYSKMKSNLLHTLLILTFCLAAQTLPISVTSATEETVNRLTATNVDPRNPNIVATSTGIPTHIATSKSKAIAVTNPKKYLIGDRLIWAVPAWVPPIIAWIACIHTQNC